MLTEVMRFYGLTRPPIEAGFFETEHHAQVSRDIRAAIMGGRLIALTSIIGSGKTILARRLRTELEREGRVIVARALSIDKAKISVPLLVAALFYDLTPEKTVKISSQSERRERDLQDLFRRVKKPRSAPSQRSCVEALDLASVSAIVRSVSNNVRRMAAPVSTNVRRAVHHCAPLQLGGCWR